MDNNDYKKFTKDVEIASRDKFVLSEWESEKMAELVKKTSLDEARAEGIEQGIEQNKNETIIAMLKKNISLEDIKDITGKSLKEIKEIEKLKNSY